MRKRDHDRTHIETILPSQRWSNLLFQTPNHQHYDF